MEYIYLSVSTSSMISNSESLKCFHFQVYIKQFSDMLSEFAVSLDTIPLEEMTNYADKIKAIAKSYQN